MRRVDHNFEIRASNFTRMSTDLWMAYSESERVPQISIDLIFLNYCVVITRLTIELYDRRVLQLHCQLLDGSLHLGI